MRRTSDLGAQPSLDIWHNFYIPKDKRFLKSSPRRRAGFLTLINKIKQNYITKKLFNTLEIIDQ